MCGRKLRSLSVPISQHEKTVWVRVRRATPCPVCERPDWCMRDAAGTFALCMRTPGGKEIHLKDGSTAWIHRLDSPLPAIPPRHRPPSSAPIRDWSEFHAKLAPTTGQTDLARLAGSLGVSAASLSRLGTAWYAGAHRPVDQPGPPGAWAFPMRSPAGTMIGIRLRADDGLKWAVTGSKQGLFLPDGGEVGDQVEEIAVCEGPTDTAAAMDLGLNAIGRPSCAGLETEASAVCVGRRVVIIGDCDAPKTRPDGTIWHPGQEGAAKFAAILRGKCKSVKLILPLRGKDIRQWLQAGATAAVLRCCIRNAKEWHG